MENLSTIDPCYKPELLELELNLRRAPLDLRTKTVQEATREEIVRSCSASAPMGLVELVEGRVDEDMLGNMTAFEKGRVWVARNDLSVARAHFEQAFNAGDLRAHSNLGQIAAIKGDYDNAWTHFSSDPNSVHLGISRCMLHLEQGDPKSSIEVGPEVNRLLGDQPLQMQIFFGGQLSLALGLAHKELGQLAACASYLEQGIKRLNSRAAYELGMLYMHPSFDEYNPQLAIDNFGRAAELGDPEGFKGIAKVLLLFNQDSGADKALLKAAEYGVKLSEDERSQIVFEREMNAQLWGNT